MRNTSINRVGAVYAGRSFGCTVKIGRSPDVKEVANRTASDPPTTCDECASSGPRAPEDPSQKPRIPQKQKWKSESDDHATDLDHVSDFQRRDDRATTQAKEGQLPKACSALLDEPPTPHNESRQGGARPLSATSSKGGSSRLRRTPSPRSPRSHWSSKPSFLLHWTQQQDRRACAHSTSMEGSSRSAETSLCEPSTPWYASWTKATLLAPLSPRSPAPRSQH